MLTNLLVSHSSSRSSTHNSLSADFKWGWLKATYNLSGSEEGKIFFLRLLSIWEAHSSSLEGNIEERCIAAGLQSREISTSKTTVQATFVTSQFSVPLEVSWLEYSLFLLFLRLGLENLAWMLWNPKSLFIDGNLDKAHLFHRRDITQIFIWTWWSTKISQILDRDALETWSTTLETLLAMSHIGWNSPKMSR